MEYFVTRLALNGPERLPLTAHQYAEIKRASEVRLEALYLEQKYDFIIENFIEFEETLLKAGVNFVVLGIKDYKSFSLDRALFDRRIMNLLTTARTYDDTRPQHLKRIVGEHSDIVGQVKAAFSAEYDSRLGYRAMCKLRNHIQHRGLPVHGSSYHSAGVHTSGPNPSMRNTIDPYLRPEELQGVGFNQEVLDELAAVGETVDLKLLIREYVEGLSAAHMTTRALIRPEVERSSLLVANLVIKYDESCLGGTIGLVAVKANERGEYVDKVTLQTMLDEHRDYLVEKNRRLVNLSRQYVSSEVVRDD